MIDVIKKYNVSRETIKKLESYQALVKEWNSKFNLISKSTENIIWERHIVDSLQLIKFITSKDKVLLDLGSGAGFPGVVLAIACQELYPDLKINLVESIGKKTTFLQEVNKILNLNMEIYKERIENLKIGKVDIITSRALASLPKLLEYAKPFCSNNTRLIFLKGEKWVQEQEEARKKWIYKCEVYDSDTSEDGKILRISDLRSKL